MDLSHSDWHEMVPHSGFDVHFLGLCFLLGPLHSSCPHRHMCWRVAVMTRAEIPGQPAALWWSLSIGWGPWAGGVSLGCVVQLPSRVRLFVTPWTAAHQASLSFTISQSLLKCMSIESVILSNHLILCCPFLLLPSIFPSIRVFSKWVSSLPQVAKVLELQLQHQSIQWIFRVDFAIYLSRAKQSISSSALEKNLIENCMDGLWEPIVIPCFTKQ